MLAILIAAHHYSSCVARELVTTKRRMLEIRQISLLLAATALCCMYGPTSAAVISIDFGSEWIKVALVKVSADVWVIL